MYICNVKNIIDMKKNETWGLFSGEEWQRQYGSGTKKAMSCILEIAGRNGIDLELKKFNTNEIDASTTVFAKTIDKFGITCYTISRDTGVNASTIYNWKAKRFRPDPYYKKVVEYIHEKTGVLLNLMDFVK